MPTPDRSPLTSARNAGTPAAESCSAISCSVLVLPVPVAPATSPCRLSIDSGTRTAASGNGVPSTMTAPSSRAGPSKAKAAPRPTASSCAGMTAPSVVTTLPVVPGGP